MDKICLYAKDLYEAKYKTLLKKREDVETKHVSNSKTFIKESCRKNIKTNHEK